MIQVNETLLQPIPHKPLERSYLSRLRGIKTAIESATGYTWRETSHIRLSPSHKDGTSLDLAPMIAENDKPHYGVYRLSDPILHKRPTLIKQLSSVIHSVPTTFPYSIGIFIETDHLHVQIFEKRVKPPFHILCPWGMPKYEYPDTTLRQNKRNVESDPDF